MTAGGGALEIARLTDVTLESGAVIPQVDIAYRVWGTVSADQSNIVGDALVPIRVGHHSRTDELERGERVAPTCKP